jgi:hypothetical protein
MNLTRNEQARRLVATDLGRGFFDIHVNRGVADFWCRECLSRWKIPINTKAYPVGDLVWVRRHFCDTLPKKTKNSEQR